MCEHLRKLDDELKGRGIRETFRGQAWSNNSREWVYYDCVLDHAKIQTRLQFPPFVQIHINNEMRSGMEAGFFCTRCNDGVMGMHSDFSEGKIVIE